MEQTMTQLNARIASETKRQGDEGLNLAHISPSRASRALWSYFARHRNDPDAITNMVEQLESAHGEELDEHARAVLAQSASLIQASSELMGLSPSTSMPPISDQDLLEQALSERYEERGLM